MKNLLNKKIIKLQCKLKECKRNITLTDFTVNTALKVQQKAQQTEFTAIKNL